MHGLVEVRDRYHAYLVPLLMPIAAYAVAASSTGRRRPPKLPPVGRSIPDAGSFTESSLECAVDGLGRKRLSLAPPAPWSALHEGGDHRPAEVIAVRRPLLIVPLLIVLLPSWPPPCPRRPAGPSPSASPTRWAAASPRSTRTSPRWAGRRRASGPCGATGAAAVDSATCVPGQGSCAFPTDMVMQLHARGITPVIWWQPIGVTADGGNGLYERYKRTLNGFHDAYITEWARAARAAGEASGKPILLRYAHEATGYWFPWSIGRFDNTKENYKAAWAYVWNIFKREGALPYVDFIWSTVFPYKWAFPGDKYVDYVGVTVLNFGSDRSWRYPGPLIGKRVRASAKFTKKPIIIAEMATAYLGGDKAQLAEAGLQAVLREVAQDRGHHVPRYGPAARHGRAARLAPRQAGRWLRPPDVPVHRLARTLPGSSLVATPGLAEARRFGVAPARHCRAQGVWRVRSAAREHGAHERTEGPRRPRGEVLPVEALV